MSITYFDTNGSAGPQGATGATGPAGGSCNPGATGPQGITGSPGPQGPSGASGTTVVGATGQQGPSGYQGNPGPSGETGATGPYGFALVTDTVSSSAVTVNWTTGPKHKINLPVTGSCAITMTAPSANGSSLQLIIVQGSTAITITWAAPIKWAGGVAYSSNAASTTDVLSFLWDGTNYYCTYSQGFA
jgi:hypothetical protein